MRDENAATRAPELAVLSAMVHGRGVDAFESGQAVLAAARGIAVPEEIRARILACSDLALLDTWLERAITAEAASEVVGA